MLSSEPRLEPRPSSSPDCAQVTRLSWTSVLTCQRQVINHLPPTSQTSVLAPACPPSSELTASLVIQSYVSKAELLNFFHPTLCLPTVPFLVSGSLVDLRAQPQPQKSAPASLLTPTSSALVRLRTSPKQMAPAACVALAPSPLDDSSIPLPANVTTKTSPATTNVPAGAEVRTSLWAHLAPHLRQAGRQVTEARPPTGDHW